MVLLLSIQHGICCFKKGWVKIEQEITADNILAGKLRERKTVGEKTSSCKILHMAIRTLDALSRQILLKAAPGERKVKL